MKRLLSFWGVLMIAITSAFAQTYQAVPGSLDHKLFRYSDSEMCVSNQIGYNYVGRYFYVDLAIPADGDYTLTFKTGAPNGGGKATIATNSGSVASVDGENTTEISFAKTGAWGTFTQSHTVLLKDVKKGNVTLTITSTDQGGDTDSPGNFKEFAVQCNVGYQAVPGSLDHKLFRYSDSEMCAANAIGYYNVGRYFYVDLAIPADGDYTLTFKTGTPNGGGKATIATNSGSVASVDGENTTEISFAQTGDWGTYTQNHTVLLKDVKKGNVTLTFTSTDKGSGKSSPGNLAEFAVQCDLCYQAVPGSLDHKLFRYSDSEMCAGNEVAYHYVGRYFHVDLAIPADGDYTLTFKTGVPNGGGKATIATNSGSVASVDGENTTEISFESTGGWTTYTQSHTVLLKDVKKGNVTLTITSTETNSKILAPGNYAEFAVQYHNCNDITFDANGGSGTMAAQTIINSGSLNANVFTRDGYTFAGWNTQADGKGTAYTDEQEIEVTGETKGAITLYAQWEETLPVAQITNKDGEVTKYTSAAGLKEALNEITTGEIGVKLLDDCDLGSDGSVALYIKTAATFDLNGYTLTGYLDMYAPTTINDSSEGKTGKVKASPGYYVLCVYDDVAVTVNGGTFEGGKSIGVAGCSVITLYGGTYCADESVGVFNLLAEGGKIVIADGYEYTDGNGNSVTGTFTYTDKLMFAGSVVESTPTAIDNIDAQNSSTVIKTIENGQVVIIKEGVKYDLMGHKI